MQREIGVLLIIASVFVCIFSISDLKVYTQVEQFVRTEDGTEVKEKVIMVPPWNASEELPPRGWVGFNVVLNHENKTNYEVHGIILLADNKTQPKLVMRVVNETGLQLLIFDNFDPYTWNSTKIYAAAYLDAEAKRLYDNFRFVQIDESSKYCFLFRGLNNGTKDTPVLISVKETWYEPKDMLNPTISNLFLASSIVTGLIGTTILIKKSGKSRKRPKKRLAYTLVVNSKSILHQSL